MQLALEVNKFNISQNNIIMKQAHTSERTERSESKQFTYNNFDNKTMII